MLSIEQDVEGERGAKEARLVPMPAPRQASTPGAGRVDDRRRPEAQGPARDEVDSSHPVDAAAADLEILDLEIVQRRGAAARRPPEELHDDPLRSRHHGVVPQGGAA